MARSSILGTDRAPREPAGHDVAALGPGDNSDSGSDMMGIADSDDTDPGLAADDAMRDDQMHPLLSPDTLDTASDAAGTGERRTAGADGLLPDGSDIGVDRIFTPGSEGADDEDPDLAFIDEAVAGNPLDDESDDDVDELDAAAAEDTAALDDADLDTDDPDTPRTAAARRKP